MMNDEELKLPVDYIPFRELIICSNHLINGKIPFLVSNNLLFLVGKEDIPLLWISAPASVDGKTWRQLVEKNQALDKRVNLIISKDEAITTVSVGNTIIFHVKKITEDKAEILLLDLRPLGLNIYGDGTGLYIGTNLFSNNTFSNVNVMMVLG